MVVKIDNARVEVELDVRSALDDLGEIESKLGEARARRRGRDRAAPGEDRRIGGRRFGQVAGLTAATAAGGLRRAVGFAAKLGGGLTIAQVIRNTPEIARALVGEEALDTRLRDLVPLPDVVVDALGISKALGDRKIENVVEELAKRISEIEGTLKTTVKAATLAYDLLLEGKITEAGAAAITEIRNSLSGLTSDPGAVNALGIGAEAVEILDAFRAYNTAESLFRQRARGVQIRNTVDDLDGLLRAAGGGASK